jgi:hypothetical protein
VHRSVTLLYVGGGILVLAQILGIYALVTHKADLIFSLLMVAMLVSAVVIGGIGAYHQLH